MYLLVNLALGYEESYLPDGLDVVNFRRTLEESNSQMSQSDRAECDEYGVGPRVDLDCYDSVQNGVPALIKLLTDNDARLRRAAIYALAWFPENAYQSLPAIRQFLANASDEIEVANALIAYGDLLRVDPLQGFVLTQHQPTHISADMIEAFISTEVFAVLLHSGGDCRRHSYQG